MSRPWNKGKKMKDLISNYVNPFADKKHTKESNFKNRIAHLGKKPTEKQLEGLKIGRKMSIKPSKETLLQNSIAHRGSNNPNWKGGIGKWRGWRWKNIREQVLKRDNYKCIKCGNKAQIVHHKIYWKLKRTYNIKFMNSMCRSCHMKEHYKEIEGGKNGTN